MCLSCLIMSLTFDVGTICLLDVNKDKHLVNSGNRSNVIKLCYGTLLRSIMDISAIKMLLLLPND